MLLRIESILNHFDDPSILLTGLFRVDGIPIVVKCRDKISILGIADWLDRYIRDSLERMIREDIDEVNAKFKDLFVRISPLTKTLALVLVSNDETSLYKFEMDISSLKIALK